MMKLSLPRYEHLVLFLLLSWVLNIGCGKKRHEDHHDFNRVFYSLRKPKSYVLHDSACQNQSNLKTNFIRNSFVWPANQQNAQQVNFLIAGNTNSFWTHATEFTQYHGLYIRECRGLLLGQSAPCKDAEGQETHFKLNSEKTGGALRICEEAFTYPRESYEGVALTSSYFIEKAAWNYEQFTGKTLKKLNLLTLPEIVSKVWKGGHGDKNVQYWETNNLAYDRSNQSIIVYPETEEQGFFVPEFGSHLWESAFVLAHEFGHHVEGAILQNIVEQTGLTWIPIEHRFTAPLKEMNAAPDQANTLESLAKFLSSLSEATADILAYYSLHGQVESLEALSCLAQSRDPRNPYFPQDLEKKLTDDVLDVFSQKKSWPEPNPAQQKNICEYINLRDPHTIGSILAHNIIRIYAEQINAPVDKPLSTQQAGLLYRQTLNFLENLNELLSNTLSLHGRATTMEQMFRLINPAIMQSLGSFNLSAQNKDKLCRSLLENMPAGGDCSR